MEWVKKNKKVIGIVFGIILTILQNAGVIPTAADTVNASTNPVGE